MTIEEIITKLNYLNGNSQNMSASQWLHEIDKYETLWCERPDNHKTRFVNYHGPMRLEMK